MYRSVERARVKQQAGIGQYSGTNDLSENVFVVKQYVHANGEKYLTYERDGKFCVWAPGGIVCGDTLDQLREAVIAALKPAETHPLVEALNLLLVDVGYVHGQVMP